MRIHTHTRARTRMHAETRRAQEIAWLKMDSVGLREFFSEPHFGGFCHAHTHNYTHTKIQRTESESESERVRERGRGRGRGRERERKRV